MSELRPEGVLAVFEYLKGSVLAITALKKSKFFNRLACVTVAVLMTAGTLPSVANAQCIKVKDSADSVISSTAAFYVRKLQSDMMVAALGCGMRQQYNLFANSYQVELKKNSNELLNMFRVQHGSLGQNKHTSFLTNMANDASLRMASTNNYCADAQLALNQLTNDHTVALEKVATAYFDSNQAVAGNEGSCSQVSSLPVQ